MVCLGHENILKLLIDNGANVKDTDHDKRTALHICAANGYAKGTELLLKAGANVNAVDRNGDTPLHR